MRVSEFYLPKHCKISQIVVYFLCNLNLPKEVIDKDAWTENTGCKDRARYDSKAARREIYNTKYAVENRKRQRYAVRPHA